MKQKDKQEIRALFSNPLFLRDRTTYHYSPMIHALIQIILPFKPRMKCDESIIG